MSSDLINEFLSAGYARIGGSNFIHHGDDLLYVYDDSQALEIDLKGVSLKKPIWNSNLDILVIGEDDNLTLVSPFGIMLDDQNIRVERLLDRQFPYFRVRRKSLGTNFIVIKNVDFGEYKWAFLFPRWSDSVRAGEVEYGDDSRLKTIKLHEGELGVSIHWRTQSFDTASRKITTTISVRPGNDDKKGKFEYEAVVTDSGTVFNRWGNQVLSIPVAIANMKDWGGNKCLVYNRSAMGVVYLPVGGKGEMLLDFRYHEWGIDDDSNMLLQDIANGGGKYGIFGIGATTSEWAVPPTFDEGIVRAGVIELWMATDETKHEVSQLNRKYVVYEYRGGGLVKKSGKAI